MPYIKQEDRERLWKDGEYAGTPFKTAGELNYTLSMTYLHGDWDNTSRLIEDIEQIVNSYWETSEQRYQVINNILGALVGANLEYQRRFAIIDGRGGDIDYVTDIVIKNFYKRTAAPYEGKAIKNNGDIL